MKKLLAMILAVTALISLTACGKGKGDGNKNDGSEGADVPGLLNISVYQGGYGVEWVDELAKDFQNKTGIQVKVNSNFIGKNGVATIRADVLAGTSSADLIITKDMMFDELYKGEREIKGYGKVDNIFEDLSPLYNEKVMDESVTLKDKMDPLFSEYYNVEVKDGVSKYYAVPWASGMIGILRNMDVWDNSWAVPRTTDEMFEVADKMKTAGKVPFIYAESDEYWSMFSHVWVAQYKGSDDMNRFYDGYKGMERYTPKMFQDEGFNSTLKILEKLLLNKNNYMHQKSHLIDFTNMQGLFLKGQAVMSPNGDWIEREMKNSYKNVNIEFMKTPLNSAIANKLSFKTAGDKDAKLRTLVDYVDTTKTGYEGKPEFATNSDVDIVRDARSIEYTVGHEHYMAIPSYAKEKEEAKKFILYMASDAGIKTYISKTGGCLLPYDYNFNESDANFSNFRKSTANIINNSKLMFSSNKNRIFSLGGVDMYWRNDKTMDTVISVLSAIDKEDYISADKIIERNNGALNAAGAWDRIKRKAGV